MDKLTREEYLTRVIKNYIGIYKERHLDSNRERTDGERDAYMLVTLDLQELLKDSAKIEQKQD